LHDAGPVAAGAATTGAFVTIASISAANAVVAHVARATAVNTAARTPSRILKLTI
jgi:hypothetical protein